MNGAQCNGPQCGRFGEAPNPGWLFLAVNAPDPLSVIQQILPGHGPQLTGTFCSYTCVADFAYLAAVDTTPASGVELPPRSGTGWPG